MAERISTSGGLAIAVLAAATFGSSGAFVKPLLESGWSPAAAVTARALTGGIALAPFAAISLRGRWGALWRARWRVVLMAVVGVAGTQLMYFAAIERIPVGVAVLTEYVSPLLLVLAAWARSRQAPAVVVLVGSAIALAGLVTVVSPGSSAGGLDPLGLTFALIAMLGCAGYYLIAARPSEGLPAVALAGSGVLLGGVLLGLIGVTGIVPFAVSSRPVALFGTHIAWWLPVLVIGVVSTAIAYATSITASEVLGSRLSSFVGLLEVVAASIYAWVLLGQALTPLQLGGGVLILIGIGFVRSEKRAAPIVIEYQPASPPGSDPISPAPIRTARSVRRPAQE